MIEIVIIKMNIFIVFIKNLIVHTRVGDDAADVY